MEKKRPNPNYIFPHEYKEMMGLTMNDHTKDIFMKDLTDKEVEYMLPDIIHPAPLNDYYVGCDYCNRENRMHVAIFNKTTSCFEYTALLFTPSPEDADIFAEAISKYFNAPLIKEI